MKNANVALWSALQYLSLSVFSPAYQVVPSSRSSLEEGSLEVRRRIPLPNGVCQNGSKFGLIPSVSLKVVRQSFKTFLNDLFWDDICWMLYLNNKIQ